MKNKCTLIIDGNWLLMSRLFSMQEYFSNLNDQDEKDRGKKMLKEQMLRSINLVCNTFDCIDNILLVADGGSWRKKLERPISVGTDYKANRKHDDAYDWFAIFSCVHELVDTFKFNGVTASCSAEIEGDDWIAYWSKKLNSEGVNCLIWSTDCDLKQLVANGPGFTGWYNHKSGLILHESFKSGTPDFMGDILNPVKDIVKKNLIKNAPKVDYINPEEIVISKIISGDSSDAIKPVAQKITESRTYGVSPKEFDKIRTNICVNKELDGINTIQSFLDNKVEIAEHICNLKKYKEQNTVDDVIERIDFNRVLVELNPDFMPAELVAVCQAEEYKEYDIRQFKNNYLSLLGEAPSEEINNIIADLPF